MSSPENPIESDPKSLKERILFMGGDPSVLDKLEVKFPTLSVVLEKITSTSVSEYDFFETIDSFNHEYMLTKGGMYRTLAVFGDHGSVTVKYYDNGSASISASWMS